MPTAYTTLTLTDGITTLDLVDDSNYQLTGSSWAPAVASRRQAAIGGQSPYNDVIETISLLVVGSDGATCLANLGALAELLEQADRWAAGDEGAAAVLLKCQPQGSNLASPLAAVVKGLAPGAPSMLGLPLTFNDLLHQYQIGPVTLSFIRSGLWLGASENQSSSSASNPTIRSVTMAGGADALYCPTDIDITGFTDSSHLTIYPGILLAANDADDLLLIEAEGLTASGWTSQADTANEASGGSVLRYTATGTAESQSGAYDLNATSFNVARQAVAIYANLRVNTASRTFKLRAEASSFTFDSISSTPDLVLPQADYDEPTLVYLGTTYLRQGHSQIRLVASVSSAVSSPTIDIDYLALLAITPNSFAINHGQAWLASPFIGTIPTNVNLAFEPRHNTDTEPFGGYQESADGNEAAFSYQGDRAIYLAGDTVAALWLGTNQTDWVDTNQSTGAVTSVALRATRYKGYLTLE